MEEVTYSIPNSEMQRENPFRWTYSQSLIIIHKVPVLRMDK